MTDSGGSFCPLSAGRVIFKCWSDDDLSLSTFPARGTEGPRKPLARPASGSGPLEPCRICPRACPHPDAPFLSPGPAPEFSQPCHWCGTLWNSVRNWSGLSRVSHPPQPFPHQGVGPRPGAQGGAMSLYSSWVGTRPRPGGESAGPLGVQTHARDSRWGARGKAQVGGGGPSTAPPQPLRVAACAHLLGT